MGSRTQPSNNQVSSLPSFHSQLRPQKPKMVSKVLIALMALCVAAMAFEAADFTDNELAAEAEFIKRDPVMQDFYLAEKRGRSMKKYKVCDQQYSDTQTCWCFRRGNKFAFCNGAAGGEGM